MRNTNRLFGFLTAFVICAFGFNSALSAQSVGDDGDYRCSVDLEGHMMFGQSFIDKIGGVTAYNYTRTDERLDYENFKIRIDYAFDEEDFLLERDTDYFARGGVSCTTPDGDSFFDGTRLGLHASYLSSGGSFNTTIRSTEETRRAFRGWDGTYLPPLINTSEPGWASPIPVSAKDNFSALVLDFTVQKDLLEFDDGALGVYGGVRFANPTYNSSLHVQQHAKFKRTAKYWINGEFWGGFIQEFENFVNLTTTGQLESTMLGPSFGLTARKDFGRFSANLSVGKSRLLELSSSDGVFLDTDDIEQTVHGINEDDEILWTRHTDAFFDGRADFDSEDTRWVDVNDMRLTLNYRVGSLSFGSGLQVSQWNDMTLSPMLVNPWGLGSGSKAPDGLDWQLRHRDVNIYSWFLRTRWFIN